MRDIDSKAFDERPKRVRKCSHCRGCGMVTEPYALVAADRFIASAPFDALCATVVGSFDIFTACREASLLAQRTLRPIAFEFNEQLVVVRAGDDTDQIARDWWRKAYNETPEQTFARR